MLISKTLEILKQKLMACKSGFKSFNKVIDSFVDLTSTSKNVI